MRRIGRMDPREPLHETVHAAFPVRVGVGIGIGIDSFHAVFSALRGPIPIPIPTPIRLRSAEIPQRSAVAHTVTVSSENPSARSRRRGLPVGDRSGLEVGGADTR